jgi:hypothetical protein
MSAPFMLRLELQDAHGAVLQHAQRKFDGLEATEQLTIGRDFACDIVLDDAHSAALHASISCDAQGRVTLRDHASVNGTWLAGKRVPTDGTLVEVNAEPVSETTAELVVGSSHLRLRLQAAERLAPEQPLPSGYVSKRRVAVSSSAPQWLQRLGSTRALLCAAGVAITVDVLLGWAEQTSQRDVWMVLASMLMAQVAGLVVWVALWSLVTRVAVGATYWKTHATIAFGMSAALLLIDWTFDIGAFAFSVLLPTTLGWWLLTGLAVLLLYMHSATALQTRQWRMLAGAALVPVLLLGMRYWQAFGSDSGRQSSQSQQVVLFPPALRIAGVSTPEALLAKARGLKDKAQKSRDKLQAEGDAASDDSGDD